MKKFLFFAMIIMAISAKAQTADSNKLFQKVQGGVIVCMTAANTFSGESQPFKVNSGIIGNIVVATPKTYHNFIYGFGDNSLKMLNGYFLPKNWDVYAVYSKVINANKHYLGVGAEKMIKAEDVKFFLFSELGTDFRGTKILSLGVFVSVQSVIWKRK